MPPKKQEEVDIATLPPWLPLVASVRFECSKARAEKLIELLKHQPKSFQKNLTRDDLIQAAKDKGLYLDPTQAADPKKKDTKIQTDISTELTPQVFGKAFNLLLGDLILQGRKNKKDIIEGKNQIPDPKAKIDPKKDTKKDAKKDTKVAQVEQPVVEEKAPEKEYQKNFDQLYLLFDFPNNFEEATQVFLNQQQLHLIILAKEKITNWGGVDMGLLDQPDNFEDALKERMEDFIDGDDDEEEEGAKQQENQNQPEAKKIQRTLSPKSKEYSSTEKNILANLKKQRGKTNRHDPVRNLVTKEIVMELDMDAEEETIKQFAETIVEELCAFSLDSQQFQEWILQKKLQPLITKPGKNQFINIQQPQAPQDPFDLEIQRITQEAQKAEEQQLAQEALQQQQEAATKGKAAKKEVKKSEEELQKEKQLAEEKKKEQEARQLMIEQALEQQQKQKQKLHLQYYRKQLNEIEAQKTGPGIQLEILLDQIEIEKKFQSTGQMPISLDDQEDTNRVSQMLQSLDSMLSGKQLPTNIIETLDAIQNKKDYPDTKSTQYKLIIDEADDIEKKSYGIKLSDNQYVCSRERLVLNNICLPGIDRFMMPEVPEKSENLRKSEKSKIYPFISVDIYEFERRQILLRFEESMKEAEPEQEWSFGDRIYLERHNRNTLSQTLFKALLYDPHMITKYNEKDDSLLVALYYKNPPGRTLRKKWSSEWKVLPNLENWINFFKNSEINQKNDFYYDIDYQTIGNLHERSKILYPTDNSLILATKYEVGDEVYLRYKVVKEDVVFGLLEDKGNCVFWAQFDDGIKLTVQLSDSEQLFKVQEQENQLQQESSKQSEKKASFNLTLPHGLILRFMANGDVVQKYTETTKSKSHSGSNMLHLYDNAEINNESELRRIITGQGSVIKYMKDGSVIILYANGNTSIQMRNDTWVTTNNKGLRKARRVKDNSEYAMDPIPCAIKTDPESGSLIYIRDDQTMVIKYTDGSQYTQHRDGTKMLVSATQDSVIVEHECDLFSILIYFKEFCTVRVSLDRVKARTDTVIGRGSAYANVGFENVFERSNDGRVVETWLGDGGRVLAYREKQELPGYKEYKTNTIHLLYLSDGGVTKIVDDGEVVLISAQERIQLNKKGEKRPDGQDLDFWLQLFSVSEERKAGVFTAELQNRVLYTKDEESNFFSISSTGEVDVHISVSLNLQQQQQQQQLGQNQNQDERPQTPDIPDGDFVEEENKFLPPPTSWIPPRLFVVNNNNTGQEYLGEVQLTNYFRLKAQNQLCTQIVDKAVQGIQNCTSLSFITQLLEYKEKKQYLIKTYIPQTLDIVPKTIKKSQTPVSKVYLFRNLLQFQPFDKDQKALHQKDLEKYEVWRKDCLRSQSEFGVIQKSEEEKDAEFNIQLRILESRRSDYTTETYDQCKPQQLKKFELLQLQSQKQKEEEVQMQNSEKNKKPVAAAALKSLQQKTQTKNLIKKAKEDNAYTKVDSFVPHYFLTLEGMEVSKKFPPEVFNVVVKAKQKVLTDNEYSQFARTISNANYTMSKPEDNEMKPLEEMGQLPQPLLVLEMPQTQAHAKQLKPIIIKPSVFTQADIEDEIKEQNKIDQANAYRCIKKKEHNVYGTERQPNQLKKVPCLLKTNPKSELNQKYILTDSLTDNRMKISSMATRVYQQAPSINDVRNEGMHQTIIKTLDKKNQIEDMIDKKNLMINADLNDALKKDFNIIPIAVRFGTLKQGGLYETKVQVKNEDVLAQRLVIKQPQTKYAKVFMRQMGPISLGLIREVFVQLDAQAEILGKFQDEFQIVSKHQIYTIPIFGQIVESTQYEKLNQEFRKINKRPIQKNYVKELRLEQNKEEEELVDSQNSDLLPKINYDKTFKIDPYQSKGLKKEADNFNDDEQ